MIDAGSARHLTQIGVSAIVPNVLDANGQISGSNNPAGITAVVPGVLTSNTQAVTGASGATVGSKPRGPHGVSRLFDSRAQGLVFDKGASQVFAPLRS